MPRARLGTLASALLYSALLSACPSAELASLNPCTVSSASIRVDTGGVSNVDLLFMIDNSSSMASEQQKLAEQLPKLVNVLVTGDRYAGSEAPAGISDKQRYFTPVKSLHLGVVSSSMHVLDETHSNQPNVNDCVGPGDDGVLLHSTEVAVDGVYVMPGEVLVRGLETGDEVVAPVPGCDEVGAQPPYQSYVAGGDLTPEQLAKNFACVSRLGVRGCPFEQQLEAMWKAVAPSDGRDPDLHVFLDGTHGHGDPDGTNAGFVRDDAILAVLLVSDEEDCSITDDGKALFAESADAEKKYGSVNLRCGAFADEAGLLWPADRYVSGLRSLKPSNQDLIVFGAIVGIPIDAIGQDFDAVLERDDMQFAVSPTNKDVPRASCTTPQGDEAYPPRRFLEVAKGFGEDAVVHSICDASFAPALDKLIERIASKLSGNCLPQPLVPDADGLVRCDVFEQLGPGKNDCDEEHGHDGEPTKRSVTEGKKQKEVTVCHMQQVAVHDKTPDEGKVGWYYDDFSPELEDDCKEGLRRRISFSFGQLPFGGAAFIECFRPVPRIESNARGMDAVNVGCEDDEGLCTDRSDEAYSLFCTPDHTCQIDCKNDPDCPPGWVCGAKQGGTSGPKYCQIPTCPADDKSAIQ